MKFSKIFAVALCVILAACALCACSDDSFEGRVAALDSSVKSVKRYTVSLTVSDVNGDNQTVVYSYKAVADKADQGYNVVVTEGRFNLDFKFEEISSNRTMTSLDTPVTLDETLFTGYSYKDGVLNCLVSAENLHKVLNIAEQAPVATTTVTVKFDKDKVNNITCNYQTTSGQEVSYLFTFEY